MQKQCVTAALAAVVFRSAACLAILLFIAIGPGAFAGSADLPAADDWISRDQTKLLFTGEPLGWDQIRATFNVEEVGAGAYAQPDPAEAHEIESVRSIGRALYEEQGLSLVLISRLSSVQAPTFDGLVIDEAKRIVANFSLKRRSGFKGKWVQSVSDHLGQVMAFSAQAGWVDAAIKLTGTPKRRADDRVLTYRFQSADQRRRLTAYLFFHRIFVTSPARPAWLFVDFAVERRFPPHMNFVLEQVSAARPRVRVVAHHDGAITTYHEGRQLERNQIERMTYCEGELVNAVDPPNDKRARLTADR